jgi:hypothetical protein
MNRVKPVASPKKKGRALQPSPFSWLCLELQLDDSPRRERGHEEPQIGLPEVRVRNSELQVDLLIDQSLPSGVGDIERIEPEL